MTQKKLVQCRPTNNRCKIDPKKRKIADMLSREQVLWIRSHYIPRDKTYGASALSRKFHVCVTVINDVINHQGGYRWDA